MLIFFSINNSLGLVSEKNNPGSIIFKKTEPSPVSSWYEIPYPQTQMEGKLQYVTLQHVSQAQQKNKALVPLIIFIYLFGCAGS